MHFLARSLLRLLTGASLASLSLPADLSCASLEAPGRQEWRLEALGGTEQWEWDSLSRLLSEETLGRKVEHQLDDAGNAVELHYPSGLQLAQDFDALDRLQVISRQPAAVYEPRAAYNFRGADRVHGQALSEQLRGAQTYAAAGRPTSAQVGLIGAPHPTFQEQQEWSPRGSRHRSRGSTTTATVGS
ncbi:MAG: hypothetical protein HC897_13490 [Thermoanaerobaculia bacterium]|nr:hypothetical protein [Thermoanaerobaculia bacterium]